MMRALNEYSGVRGISTLGNQDEINVSKTWHLEITKQTRATRMTAVEPADDKSKVLGRVS